MGEPAASQVWQTSTHFTRQIFRLLDAALTVLLSRAKRPIEQQLICLVDVTPMMV